MSAEVKNKLSEIENIVKSKFPNQSCYFRGEPKFYENISASLHRHRQIILPCYHTEKAGMKFKMEGGIKFDEPQRVTLSLNRNSFAYIEVNNLVFEVDIRNPESLYEMTMVAGNFILEQTGNSSNNATALGILQHLGYPTPYIDFTKDYLVSLFFACDKLPDEDGRIIILGNDGSYKFHDMIQAEFSIAKERAIAQKSVMLEKLELKKTEDNYIECRIPYNLKENISKYLKKCNINATSLFPDSWNYEKEYEPFKKFYQGVKAEVDGKALDAIRLYNDAIDLNPNFIGAYKRRGRILYYKQDFRKAQCDIEKSCDLEKERGLYNLNREDEIIEFHPFCDECNAGCMHHILGKIYEHYGDNITSQECMRKAEYIQYRYNRREERQKQEKRRKG